MNIVVHGLLTHYTRAGKGKLLLMVPGWADTSASWQNLQTALAAHYTVVVLDLPGFGGSQMSDSAWGLPEYADFIGQFMTKLGAGDPYCLIGHSNGGAIAITALASQTVSCQKLVLLASAGIRNQDGRRKTGLKLLAKSGKIIAAPLPDALQKRLRQKLYAAAGSEMLVAEHMQETFKKIVSADVLLAAASIYLPTLLIYGDKDTATPVDFGKIFQKVIKHAELRIVPRAGHFVFIDAPEQTVTYILDFLGS